MQQRGHSHVAIAVLLALCVALAISPSDALSSASATPPCGSATTATLTAVDAMVARNIYLDELKGPETQRDQSQVASYTPLLEAVAASDQAGIKAAVKALVHSHTHIVRLRISSGGKLLADEGGPYIIAPVGGNLVFHGRTIGRYLLSVQDDLGFYGLEHRLIGVPVSLRSEGKRIPIAGPLRTGHTVVPSSGEVRLYGHVFDAITFVAKAYPRGSLQISLFHAKQRDATVGCAVVAADEITRIVHRIWARFVLNSAPTTGFVSFSHGHTGALVFVRGPEGQVAGTSSPGPAKLPRSGSVEYAGTKYLVRSFAATPGSPLRIYTLVATA